MIKKVIQDNNLYKAADDFFDVMSREKQERDGEIVELDLERIRTRDNVRETYGKIKEMAKSIKQRGLLQPITVTPGRDGYYEIIFGHRRYKGYCLLNEQEPDKYLRIRAIVKEKGAFNEEEIKEIQLIENIQRENLTAMEMKNALEYFRAKGLSHKEIADRISKSEGYVRHIFSAIKTINESSELGELMKSDAGITLADIQTVKPLPAKDQLKLIIEKIEGNLKSREELRARVRELKEKQYGDNKEYYRQRKNFSVVSYKDDQLKVKTFTFNPQKASKEDREKLLAMLKQVISYVQGAAND
ncbi:MAG TPA: ParB/RepB/Spo0J family partition protein [Spirochaetota bacterium]|nr:ParB/RepB/Spo0J family partition protein [Spirochaetota bacterium]